MKNIVKISTLAFIASAILVPTAAHAQDWRREKTANEWRTIATISGALGLLGRLNHDDTLTFAGAAGALYSAYRYDQDIRSIDRYNRTRAEYFDRDYFYRDGHRYERREVWQHGQKYYQFVDCDYDLRNRGNDWFNTRQRHDDNEWRRAEQRRQDDERRRDDQRRREDDRRRDEERRREDSRRRDEDRWDRDHRNDRTHDNGNRGNSQGRGNSRGKRDDRDNRDNRDNRDDRDNRDNRDYRDNRDDDRNGRGGN